MSVLKLITGPQFDPLSLREVKAHLRITPTDITQDALIYLSLRAAVEKFERYGVVRRALMPQTWELVLQCWPGTDYIELPLPPLVSVTSVKYLNDDSPTVETTFTGYIVSTDREPGRITLASGQSWPGTSLYPSDPIRIRYTCGYTDASQVPASIRRAILLLVEKHYDGHDLSDVGALIDRAVAGETVNYVTEYGF